jgi:hypothetical protein
MADLPDFQLLTSFYLSRPTKDYIALTKEYNFNTPNNGILAIGAVLDDTTWKRAGYIYPLYDYLATTGDRLVGGSRLLRQSNSYQQFEVMTFDYSLIGFKLICVPWVNSISCEVHLGIIK